MRERERVREHENEGMRMRMNRTGKSCRGDRQTDRQTDRRTGALGVSSVASFDFVRVEGEGNGS